MENSLIEDFYKLSLYHKDLTNLATEVVATIAITSMAATECAALMRLQIDAAHKKTGNDDLDMMSHLHRNVISRTWSAKLFEFWEFMKPSKSDQDDSLKIMKAKWLSEYERCKSGLGYTIARDMRHEAANHYSLTAATKNIAHMQGSDDYSMILHETVGNTHYLMGETIMVLGRLRRMGYGTSMDDLLKAQAALDDWNKDVTQLITAFNHDLTTTYVLPSIEGRRPKKWTAFIPEALCTHPDQPNSPVIMRLGRKRRKDTK